MWKLAAIIFLVGSILENGEATRNGPSDFSIICARMPSMNYCQQRALAKGSGQPMSSNNFPQGGPPPSGAGLVPQSFKSAPGPIPPPLPTPPPIGAMPGPAAPLPTPPPISQPMPMQQPQPFVPQPQPQQMPMPMPAPQPIAPQQPFPQSQSVPQSAFPAPPQAPVNNMPAPPQAAPSSGGGGGGLGSIGAPLGFLGGGGNTAPSYPGPSGGSAPLSVGSGTQVGPFAGVGRNTAVNPLSGVSSGTSVNAAGLPISSGGGVNFGGLIPGGLSNMFGRRRREALPDWYTKYLRAKLQL